MSSKYIFRLSLFCLFLFTLSLSAAAQSGYQIHTGIDLLPGDKTTSTRFQIVNSYQFTPKLSAGLGTGFTYYDDPLSLLPLFINMKYEPWQGRITPFLFLNTGYSFSILSDTNTPVDSHSGGFMLNPGVGLQFEAKSGLGWYLNAGYNTDNSTFIRERGDGRSTETDISYKRLVFGAGVAF